MRVFASLQIERLKFIAFVTLDNFKAVLQKDLPGVSMMVIFFSIGAGTIAAENLDKKLVPNEDKPENGNSSTPVTAFPLIRIGIYVIILAL